MIFEYFLIFLKSVPEIRFPIYCFLIFFLLKITCLLSYVKKILHHGRSVFFCTLTPLVSISWHINQVCIFRAIKGAVSYSFFLEKSENFQVYVLLFFILQKCHDFCFMSKLLKIVIFYILKGRVFFLTPK